MNGWTREWTKGRLEHLFHDGHIWDIIHNYPPSIIGKKKGHTEIIKCVMRRKNDGDEKWGVN